MKHGQHGQHGPAVELSKTTFSYWTGTPCPPCPPCLSYMNQPVGHLAATITHDIVKMKETLRNEMGR